jgi:hypothetical protein
MVAPELNWKLYRQENLNKYALTSHGVLFMSKFVISSCNLMTFASCSLVFFFFTVVTVVVTVKNQACSCKLLFKLRCDFQHHNNATFSEIMGKFPSLINTMQGRPYACMHVRGAHGLGGAAQHCFCKVNIGQLSSGGQPDIALLKATSRWSGVGYRTISPFPATLLIAVQFIVIREPRGLFELAADDACPHPASS